MPPGVSICKYYQLSSAANSTVTLSDQPAFPVIFCPY